MRGRLVSPRTASLFGRLRLKRLSSCDGRMPQAHRRLCMTCNATTQGHGPATCSRPGLGSSTYSGAVCSVPVFRGLVGNTLQEVGTCRMMPQSGSCMGTDGTPRASCRITVYHYRTQSVHTLEASDPYARGLTANGDRCIFVDLDNDTALMPEGWTTHDTPAIQGVALQLYLEI
jgi:hypothetical protein